MLRICAIEELNGFLIQSPVMEGQPCHFDEFRYRAPDLQAETGPRGPQEGPGVGDPTSRQRECHCYPK